MLAVFLSGLHWAWWCWATRLQSWGSSAGGPGSGRGTGLGCPLGDLACPFPDRLALCGAEGARAGHLVGRVLCAGGLVGVGSTVDTGDLRPSGLGGGGSSLWADAWDEALDSMGAPFPCRALGVLLSDSQRDPRVHPCEEKSRHMSVVTRLAAPLKTRSPQHARERSRQAKW